MKKLNWKKLLHDVVKVLVGFITGSLTDIIS